MARDFSSSRYQQIAAEWAEKIDKGEHPNGHQLPTREQLAKDHGVSLQVVRDALVLLHTEGYIRSEPSRSGGTFVYRPPRLDVPFSYFEDTDIERDSFAALVEDQGHRSRQEIDVKIMEADDRRVPDGLRLADGARVAARQRLRFVDEIPYAISNSFYPMEIVRETPVADPADIPRGARHVLAELGCAMTKHVDRIECRRPHPDEVGELKIAPGLSVFSHIRTSYTDTGRPVRILVSILPSDRWRIVYEVS